MSYGQLCGKSILKRSALLLCVIVVHVSCKALRCSHSCSQHSRHFVALLQLLIMTPIYRRKLSADHTAQPHCSAPSQLQVAEGVESNPIDGFFTSAAGLGALGVASGYQDSSQASLSSNSYAPALIDRCSTAFLSATTPRPGPSSIKPQVVDPAYILAHAQQATCQAGTAAVTLAALQPGGKLCVTNLGNCRALLLRNGEIWDQTDDQLHDEVWGVRKPYQIGHPAHAEGADSIHDAER